MPESRNSFMRRTASILLTVAAAIIFTACDDLSEKQNPLYGKIFSDLKDLPELKNYTHIAGSVIYDSKAPNGDYRFAISYYQDGDKRICIFEELLKSGEKGDIKYKILDTITIGKIRNNEYFTFCNCRRDTIWDSEIIALVVAEDDKEFYDKIVKAWRADTKTGKIIIIKNTEGINCSNEGYGLDACGEDDEAVDPALSSNADTLQLNEGTETKTDTLEIEQ